MTVETRRLLERALAAQERWQPGGAMPPVDRATV
jgi:hypothetical protein